MKVIRIGAVLLVSLFASSCKMLEDCKAFWNKWDMEEGVNDLFKKDDIKLVALRNIRPAPLDRTASEGFNGFTCKADGLMTDNRTLKLTFTFYTDKDGNGIISTEYE